MRAALGRITALALLGLVVGGLASLGAIAFVEAVAWLNDALLVSPRARIQHEQRPQLIVLATLAVPALGGLAVGLMLRYLVRERRSLGPADTILAVQAPVPSPSPASGLASTLAAALSLGTGASVGQYGPMVYLGTVIGALAERCRLPLRNLRAIGIGCGVAAAISTAFNAPLAGLVFAHEVILRHYAMQAFAPATVAAATGYVLANVVFGRPPLFEVSFAGVRYGYEFAAFAAEGLLCALLAMAFMRGVLACSRLAARTPLPAPFKPAAAGLALGLVALWVPDVLGTGQEALRFATIEGAFGLGELAVLIVAKAAVTALCLGYGFAGGVFSPALLIGILFGALFGSLLQASGVAATSPVVVYAICGMMATASPVIGAPLTTIVIVFELTRSYDLTIAAMVAVVFSNLVSFRGFGRSLFDVQLAAGGFDLRAGRDGAVLGALAVSTVMRTDLPVARRDEPLARVTERLAATGHAECAVIGGDGVYAGVLHLHDASGKPGDLPAGSIARMPDVVFDEATSVASAMEAMRGFVGEAAPVVSSDHGRLLGMIPESALIEAYLDRVHELRREENEAL